MLVSWKVGIHICSKAYEGTSSNGKWEMRNGQKHKAFDGTRVRAYEFKWGVWAYDHGLRDFGNPSLAHAPLQRFDSALERRHLLFQVRHASLQLLAPDFLISQQGLDPSKAFEDCLVFLL